MTDSRGEGVQFGLFQVKPQADRQGLDQVAVLFALPPQHMADAAGGDRLTIRLGEPFNDLAFGAEARKMPAAKLYQHEQAQRDAEPAKLYSDKGEIAFGNHIRS